MTKREVVSFFLDLEAMAGPERVRITGHSGRVTGAMRMAWAKLTLHKIKVFGRWGSAAVERYVRDAILGMAGGDVAQLTEGVKKKKKPTTTKQPAARNHRMFRGGRKQRVAEEDEDGED